MKVCSMCKVGKPLSEYYKNRTSSDGFSYACKNCMKNYCSIWRNHNSEYFKTWRNNNPDYTSKSIQRNKEYQKEYYLKNKDKLLKNKAINYTTIQTAVAQKVRLALENGMLKKADSCELCNSIGNLIAHHNDYTNPLVVLWVCKFCHMRIHKGIHKKIEKNICPWPPKNT